MKFDVDATDWTRGFLRYLLAFALIGEVLNLSFFLWGSFTRETTLVVGLFVLAAVSLAALNFWLMRRGSIELTNSGFEVRTRVSKQLYNWSDVADMRVETWGRLGLVDRLWARLIGLDSDRRFIEVDLRRSDRLGIPGLFGTAIPGIPSLIATKVRVYVTDLDDFLKAVRTVVRT